MADSSITLNSGTGGASLATYTDSGSVVHQRVVLETQSSTSDPAHVNSSNPLPVTLANTGANATAVKVDGSAVTQPVSASSLPLPTGAASAAKQPALGTAGTASADVITVQGIASMTALKVDGSAVTQPVSGTVTANLGTLNGVALDTSVNGLLIAQSAALGTNKGPLVQGSVTTAAPTYTTGNINPLSLDTSGNLRVNIAAGGITSGTAGTPSSQVLSVQGISGMTAVKVDGSAVTQPVSGTFWQTTQPVSLASLPALAAGTNAIGQVNLSPVSGQGWPSTYSGSIAATVTPVKASAGTLGAYYIYNANAAVAYVQIFDLATGSVTLGTTAPKWSIGIPPGGAANLEFANGIKFSNAITIAVTTTRAGSTGPGSTVDINMAYD